MNWLTVNGCCYISRAHRPASHIADEKLVLNSPAAAVDPRQPILAAPGAKEIKMPTQEEINDGQKEINGKLCQVDWRIIVALRAIRTALNRCAGCPESELAMLDQAIAKIDSMSVTVAKVDPPGCLPEDRTTPDQ